MAITININGLTLCHKGSGGVSHNTMPDVCKTPPFGVPVSYENEAYSADLVKGTVSVFADGGNMIANMGHSLRAAYSMSRGAWEGLSQGRTKPRRNGYHIRLMYFLRKNLRVD
ncbi:DUF4150 domain-containing protein [Salmonella enterica]|nr:DUF4150 domain-containing protein [Salmonella enterica]EHJ0755049.1 DUF4150 domain-containing protein [Salmonella enterica]HAU3146397.1 DUF4150 domain-containing protein [Salmonella enterica subsp. salamae]